MSEQYGRRISNLEEERSALLEKVEDLQASLEHAEAEGEDLQVTCNKAFSGIGRWYMVDGVRTFLFIVRERKLGT